jgi:hypothetical protein
MIEFGHGKVCSVADALKPVDPTYDPSNPAAIAETIGMSRR